MLASVSGISGNVQCELPERYWERVSIAVGDEGEMGRKRKSDGRGVVRKVAERFFLLMKSGYEPNHGKCGWTWKADPRQISSLQQHLKLQSELCLVPAPLLGQAANTEQLAWPAWWVGEMQLTK